MWKFHNTHAFRIPQTSKNDSLQKAAHSKKSVGFMMTLLIVVNGGFLS